MKRSVIVAVATIALFAFTAGGYAAGRYVITSTKQIKPSVLRQLHGARGPRGRVGPTGEEGPPSATALDQPPPQVRTYKSLSSFDDAELPSDGSRKTFFAPCGNDQVAGGGYRESNAVIDMAESGTGGWYVMAHLAPGATSGIVIASAVCLSQ